MKKYFLTIAIISVVCLFSFTGCEKEVSNGNLQVTDSKDVLDIENNPDTITIVFLDREQHVMLEPVVGNATFTHTSTGATVLSNCSGQGNNCGRAWVDNNGNQTEGIYAHVYGDEGEVIATYYNWNRQYNP